jgi:GxxExxY protein
LRVASQVPLPVVYEGVKLEIGYRLDLVVEECIVVEVKAVEKLIPVNEAQLISYLKLSGKKVGLLINFHELHLKDGIKRRVV